MVALLISPSRGVNSCEKKPRDLLYTWHVRYSYEALGRDNCPINGGEFCFQGH